MKDDSIRKITTTGQTGTYYVTIPKDIIRGLKWQKGQKVTVTLEGSRVIIEDWPRKPSDKSPQKG